MSQEKESTVVGETIEAGLQQRRDAKSAIQGNPNAPVPGNPGMPNINETFGSMGSAGKRLAGVKSDELKITSATPLSMVYTRNLVINIHQMLVEAAQRRETLTYEMIALRHGLPASGSQLGQVVAPLLGRIFTYCVKRGLPYLTVIVVRKSGSEKGVPGNGFWKLLTEVQADAEKHTPVAPENISTIANKRAVTAALQDEVFKFYSLEDI